MIGKGCGLESGATACLVGVRDLALRIGVLIGVVGVGNPNPVLWVLV